MLPRFPKRPTGPAPDQSSNVVSFLHDPVSKKLTIDFHGGRSYRYDNVSEETVKRLERSESKGAFVNTHITPHHTFVKTKGDRTF